MRKMKDYTQYGEKIFIDEFFKDRIGFFVDIGAADGVTHSNTLHLIESGWKGILIEPCRHFLRNLHDIHANNDNIKIFEGAVSDFDGKTEFYVYETEGDSQISTISLGQNCQLK